MNEAISVDEDREVLAMVDIVTGKIKAKYRYCRIRPVKVTEHRFWVLYLEAPRNIKNGDFIGAIATTMGEIKKVWPSGSCIPHNPGGVGRNKEGSHIAAIWLPIPPLTKDDFVKVFDLQQTGEVDIEQWSAES